MRRDSGKPQRPIANPFAIWADFALRHGKGMLELLQRAAEKRGGVKVAVIPTADAPPKKARPRRKLRARAKR